jgi:D-alanine-D-alanine ligase
MSAASVWRAIDRTRFEPVPIGITPEGQWLLVRDPQAAFADGLSPCAGPAVQFPGRPGGGGILVETPGGGTEWMSLDILFPVLHGPYGEDGTVQGLFELIGMPYVGSGVMGSAAGMDKGIMKRLFVADGIPTPHFMVVTRKAWETQPEEILGAVDANLAAPPWFVKPANLGSSVGVTKVKQARDLRVAIDAAAKYDRRIVVEEGIDGREIECSVLGNDDPIASVAGEIIPSREFYDYHAKYLDGKSEGIVPADLPDAVADEVRRLAIRAFVVTDCAGMARVDFMVRRADDKVFVNEINTIPGFTSISMYPKLFEASGVPYPALITRLIELGLERFADRQRSLTRWDGC